MREPLDSEQMSTSQWASRLFLQAAKLVGNDLFVETGTCHGWTAVRMAKAFKRVITIEAHVSRQAAAKEAFDRPNITWMPGNSADVLQKLAPGKSPSAVFWLDAHCDNPELPECPILKELAALTRWTGVPRDKMVVVVDDIRHFLAPPPKPCRPAEWPNMQEFMAAAAPLGEFMCLAGIGVIYPSSQKDAWIEFWRDNFREVKFEADPHPLEE